MIPIGRHGAVYGGSTKATYTIILLNVIVYVITSGENFFLQTSQYWIDKAALTPVLLLDYTQWYRLITSMFLHADIVHIFFNMYFLFLFGREIEKVIGSARFLALYLLSGLAATAFHIAFTPIVGIHTVFIPALGASGAISGVLGAYLLLFPNRRLSICWFLWILPVCFTASARAFLIFWFALQVIYGYMRLGSVAFFAHAGGFVMGLALLPLVYSYRRAFGHVMPSPIIARGGYPYYYMSYTGGVEPPGYYYYWYRQGLGRGAKAVLVLLLLLLTAGGVYSLFISEYSHSTVYMYTITAGLAGSSTARTDVAVYVPGEGVKLLPVEEEPRIVINRLEWSGLLHGEPNAYYPRLVYVNTSVRTPFPGVSVALKINATMKYDERGVLVFSSGYMATDVVIIRGSTASRGATVVYEYTLVSEGAVANVEQRLILPTALASVSISLGALYVVVRKSDAIAIE